MHDIAELLRGKIKELLEGDSTVGVGAEGALLLDLGSRGRILIPESELLKAAGKGSLAYSVSAMLSVWDVSCRGRGRSRGCGRGASIKDWDLCCGRD